MLKAVMDKEHLSWRSFADPGEPGQGAIASRWNMNSTPTLYVIDPKGVIRHKWVGSSPDENRLDAVLDSLIKVSEESGRRPP
jgi:hypothetical protein